MQLLKQMWLICAGVENAQTLFDWKKVSCRKAHKEWLYYGYKYMCICVHVWKWLKKNPGISRH